MLHVQSYVDALLLNCFKVDMPNTFQIFYIILRDVFVQFAFLLNSLSLAVSHSLAELQIAMCFLGRCITMSMR